MRGFDRRNGVGRTRRQKSRLLMKWGNRCRRFHRIVRVVGESCTHFPFRMRCFFFVAPNRNRFQCWHSIAVASQKSNSSLPGIRPHPENEEQLAAMRILPLSQNVPPISAQLGKRFPPPRHGHCPHPQNRHVTTSRLDRRDVAFVCGMGVLAFVKTAFSLSCDPAKKPLDANVPF